MQNDIPNSNQILWPHSALLSTPFQIIKTPYVAKRLDLVMSQKVRLLLVELRKLLWILSLGSTN